MEKETAYIRLNEWAEKIGVSTQTAFKWAHAGRISGALYPARGVWLIPEDAKRPIAGQPWQFTDRHRDREKMSGNKNTSSFG